MAQIKPAIYIVDDEPLQRDMLQDHLGKMSGYEIVSFYIYVVYIE
jgi:response regulator RpfG family c-di-GMP phosphodiesterase